MTVAYSSYRNSGVLWAPNIPAHWDVRRISTLGRVGNGSTPSRSSTAYWGESGTPWINSGTVHQGVVTKSPRWVTQIAIKECHLPIVPRGAVVIALTGQGKTRGTAAVLGVDSTISQHLAYIDVKRSLISGEYLRFALMAAYDMLRTISDSAGGTKGALTCSAVKYFSVMLPPIAEQSQIVTYLQAQDARIARFIKGKRELIGLLTEQKLRIIDHAVTRGLDASVKLKPSGVEWLGEVPEHWEMLHIGSSVQVVNGYPFDSERFDPVIGYSLIRIRDLRRTETEVKYNGPEVVEAVVDSGDLIVGMDGDFNVARWKGGRALLNQRMCCLRPRTRVSAAYLELVLPKALKFINDMTLSTTVKHLASGDMKRLRFPVPDRDEQDRIVRYVSCALVPIELAISNTEEEIKLIREYRDRLIFDVVTGQVDVRGWQPGPDDVVSDDDLAVLGDDEIEPDEEGVDDDA